ncbi:MAG: thymidylate synthase, partial [Solirubrobacteraceae bacterium]|nr:thymidylate synthase [Solirubrobacteraceae bacterium]
MLAAIRDGGVRVQTKQGLQALALAGQPMRFPIAHGAAVITERSIKSFVGKAIGELCAFINGARTLEQLAEFGCDWWD